MIGVPPFLTDRIRLYADRAYIPAMPKKPKRTPAGKPARRPKTVSWSVHRIAAKLQPIGTIEAPDDEREALATALRKLPISPADARRIVVRRSPYG